MAGDWIKFECCTPEKHEVLAITVIMGWEDPDITIGKLVRVWRWFDQHTVDGNAASVTYSLLDRIVGVTGFSEAMQKVGWLSFSEDGISLPNFDRHNGKTAKERALTAKRVSLHKAKSKSNNKTNADVNGQSVTQALPREEKRREDIKEPPNPQGGADPDTAKPKRVRKDRIQLKTFIERCTAAGEKPISEYSALLTYCEETGLPMEFVSIAWDQFKREFLTGHNSSRLQADWRRHFLNYVTKGYYRLWYAKPGVGDSPPTFELSTTGLQAKAQFSRGSQ